MVQTQAAPRPNPILIVLIALVAVFVLGDAVFAAQLVAHRASPPVVTAPVGTAPQQAASSAHPCNHGYYVSQAAHARKGGQYVSGIARSGLGKNGSCAAPLPAQPPSSSGPAGS